MMTREERGAAVVRFHKNGANCAQAMLAAFCDKLGMSEEQALGVGACLGGGARCGSLCGAVNAALMVLGCADPKAAGNKPYSTQLAHEYHRRFQERYHHLNCRELLADDDPHPSETALALAGDSRCGALIVTAAELLCDMLEELN